MIGPSKEWDQPQSLYSVFVAGQVLVRKEPVVGGAFNLVRVLERGGNDVYDDLLVEDPGGNQGLLGYLGVLKYRWTDKAEGRELWAAAEVAIRVERSSRE